MAQLTCRISVLVTIVFAGSICFADITTVTGTVEAVDAKKQTVSVQRAKGEEPTKFKVAPTAEILADDFSIDFASLKRGDVVLLTYDTAAKHLIKIEKIGDPSTSGISLFNGENLDGWIVGLPRIGATQGEWAVDPEQHVLVSPGANHSNWLETVRQYKNFRLSLEFRLPPGQQGSANGSGVMVRVAGRHSAGRDPRGVEVEINNDGTGALIAYETPLEPVKSKVVDGPDHRTIEPMAKALKPAGDWNTMVIECERDRITVTLNDVLVNQASGVEASKGKICLRNQGTAIEFRNIRIDDPDNAQLTPLGKWIERRPGTQLGDRVRAFSTDGKLTLFLTKTKQRTVGRWRQEGTRVFFTEEGGRGSNPADEKWFEIKDRSETDLVILMGGDREYRWEAVR